MIQVKIKRSEGNITSFEISGHANSGPYGFDLVCAAVSAVSFGSINAALKLGTSDLNIVQGEDGGYLKVDIPSTLSNERFEKVQLIFEAMIVSLETIEREYKQFIRIQDHRGGADEC